MELSVNVQCFQPNDVPACIQRQMVELWHRQQRAAEETTMLTAELHNVCQHYIRQQGLLRSAMQGCWDAGDRASATALFKMMYTIGGALSGHYHTSV